MSAKRKNVLRIKIPERRIDYIMSLVPKPFADSEAEESSDDESTLADGPQKNVEEHSSLTILDPVYEQLIFEDISDAPMEIWTLDVNQSGTGSSPTAEMMHTALPGVSCISPATTVQSPLSSVVTDEQQSSNKSEQPSPSVDRDKQQPGVSRIMTPPSRTTRASSIGRTSKEGRTHLQKRISHPKTAKKLTQKQFKWKKTHFGGEAAITDPEFPHPERHETPYHYFKYFFDDALIDLIVENTNLYSTQESGKCLGINKYDIMDFLAIELLMGVVQMPSYTDYWSGNLRFDKIANIMPLKRYQSIRRFLHFANNEHMNDDRYYKIRPVLEHIRQKCVSLEQEKKNSIDEMMIPYKGTRAGSRSQYMKNKPTKLGFKLYVRASISGIIHDFIIYMVGMIHLRIMCSQMRCSNLVLVLK
ncbi:uncharacterized protein LOC120350124 isoform X2 [Nilaparvata lugens]|uniref:uncharacterized protein LOC120350124 isoform X1 n=1 Tax=Nilaparvata lugens TaxID=108931 RepID=UPI00193D495E|nr:uncharacterized protein LOC120350124 isoform X1 [Nilaparvata lugens]XP_039278471.1 uncharacterized protein LOC120350124 isoform X2 [Nilaparvata lugens]